MAADDIFILGDWGTLLNSKGETVNRIGQSATVTATERIRATGKARVTLEVKSEPILVDLDPQRIGAPVAKAIEEAVRFRLENNLETAKPGTIEARKRAAAAFDRGESWTRKEYGGGRTGPMRPYRSNSVRRGVDSGRLAHTLQMRFAPRSGDYMLNTAANRLTPDFLSRHPDFLPWLVTSIVQPALADKSLSKAIAQALGDSVQKVHDARLAMQKRLRDNARGLIDATRGLGNELEQLSDEPDEP